MKVGIPQPLVGYTGGNERVEAEGATVAELFADLDRHYPGIRFRMVNELGELRPHVRVFINRDRARSLDAPIAPDDEIQILQALSGG